jgi:hypothetical protein
MRKTPTLFLLILISSFFLTADAIGKTKVAFGYLANNSDESNYNYLETIFPNSFASSIRNIFDVDVMKPHEINEKLAITNLALKKIYDTFELKELVSKIGSDIFIYGSFSPLPGNRIKIILNLYKKKTDYIFTFTNIGKMETEIFKLVDRITQILINYLDREKIYRRTVIKKGANLAVLTNLSGSNLNRLYITLLENGYRLVHFQGNQLNNIVDNKKIKRFRYLSSSDNTFDYITDYRTMYFNFGTWAGPGHKGKVDRLRKIYSKYDYDYLDTKTAVIKRLNSVYGNTLDNLLIIGFSNNRKKAWVRSIDLKKRDLIWMQSNIKGGDVGTLSRNIVKRMSKPMKKLQLKKNQ